MKHALARLVLRLTGWRLRDPVPTLRRYVLIAAPHTSNWDLLYLLALAWSAGVSVSWMGKHTLFPPLLGRVMRWLGGIPVRRERRNDLVSQLRELFRERSDLILVVPAEGTRDRVEYWKSGFYRIALASDVPVVPGYLHYPTRCGGFGAPLHLSGDIARDMDALRSFYADKVGRHPESAGPVRLREEVDDEVGSLLVSDLLPEGAASEA